jgi:hypothetical protein
VTEPVRVIKGNPTEEELAALLMVLRGRASNAEVPPDTPPADNGWSAYWRSVRAPIRPGPGVWRASARAG